MIKRITMYNQHGYTGTLWLEGFERTTGLEYSPELGLVLAGIGVQWCGDVTRMVVHSLEPGKSEVEG